MIVIKHTTDKKNLGREIEVASEIELSNDYIFVPTLVVEKNDRITLSNANYIIKGVVKE